MLNKYLKNKKIILASKSPRRKQLLQGLNIPFEIRTKDVDESWPDYIKGEEIALYLAEIKSEAFRSELTPDEILITADTIVRLDNEILNKPANESEAMQMHQKLKGKKHLVTTGVCLSSCLQHTSFACTTEVEFNSLSDEEIRYYITTCKPIDKAGAYGIQEWFGYVGIKSMRGDFFNVMGLPVNRLYFELKKFLTLE
ncbi:MAG: Maf family nucleotide pyrophosphatase [Flavobacteriales bacterium]